MLKIARRQLSVFERQNVEALKRALLEFLRTEPEFVEPFSRVPEPEAWLDQMVEDGRKYGLHTERALALFTTTRLLLRDNPSADAEYIGFLAEQGTQADQKVEAAIEAVRALAA